jgi:hypothetical protein
MNSHREFIVRTSEDTDGENVSAMCVLREIHDKMCFCGVGPDECDTEGIQSTLLEAAQAIISTDRWSGTFEDGWISVEAA